MSPVVMLAASAAPIIAQIVVVIIGFVITLWILKVLAWQPVLDILDQRREAVRDEFDKLENRQAELDSKIRDYEERLRRIEDERSEQMKKAIEAGRQVQNQLVEEAQKEAEEIKQKAQASIQLEIEKARVELRDEMAAMVLTATERLLDQKLDDAQHKKLVGSFIDELAGKESS